MASEKSTESKYEKAGATAAVTGALIAFNPALALLYGGYKLITGAVGTKVETARREGRAEGRNEAKAEYAHIFDKVKAQAEDRKRHAREQNRYEDLTQALFAVGLAVLAQCDALTPDNVTGIKEFAFGSAHGSLPDAVLTEIARVEASPPNLATALARARKVAIDDIDLIDQMVHVASDSVGAEAGRTLVSIWAQLRATA